jgi:hypothetical protein
VIGGRNIRARRPGFARGRPGPGSDRAIRGARRARARVLLWEALVSGLAGGTKVEKRPPVWIWWLPLRLALASDTGEAEVLVGY